MMPSLPPCSHPHNQKLRARKVFLVPPPPPRPPSLPSLLRKYCNKTHTSPNLTPEPSSCKDYCSCDTEVGIAAQWAHASLYFSSIGTKPAQTILPLAGPSHKLHGNPHKATTPQQYQHRRTGTATTRKDPALPPPPPPPLRRSPSFVDHIRPKKLPGMADRGVNLNSDPAHHALQALVYSMFPAPRCASSLRLVPTQ